MPMYYLNNTGDRWTYRPEQEPRKFVLVLPDGTEKLRVADYFESFGNFVGCVFRYRGKVYRRLRLPNTEDREIDGKTYPVLRL